jgi:hypothetical protein
VASITAGEKLLGHLEELELAAGIGSDKFDLKVGHNN